MSSAYVLNSRRRPSPAPKKKKPPTYSVVNNVSLPPRMTNIVPVSLKNRASSDSVLLSCFVDMNAGTKHSPEVDTVPKGPYVVRVPLLATWHQVSDIVLNHLRITQKEERSEWLGSDGTMLHGTHQEDRLTAAKRRHAAIDAGRSIQLRQSSSIQSPTSTYNEGAVHETNGTRLTAPSSLYYPDSDTAPTHSPVRSSNITTTDTSVVKKGKDSRRLRPEDEAAQANYTTLNSLSSILDASPCGTGMQDRSLGPVVPSSGSSGDIPKKGTSSQLCLLLRPANPIGGVVRFPEDVLHQLRMESYLGSEVPPTSVDDIPFQNVLSHYLAEVRNDGILTPKDLHWCLAPDPALLSQKSRAERVAEAATEQLKNEAVAQQRAQSIKEIERRRGEREHAAIVQSYERDTTLQQELLSIPPKIAGFDLERKDAHAAIERKRKVQQERESARFTRKQDAAMEGARNWGSLVATNIVLPEELERENIQLMMEDELGSTLDSFLKDCAHTRRYERVKEGMKEVRTAVDEYASLESVRPDPLDPASLASVDTARALVSGCAINVADPAYRGRTLFRPNSNNRSYCAVRPGTFSERGHNPSAVASGATGGVSKDTMGTMLQALGMPGAARARGSSKQQAPQ